ncbi:type I-B CRISPR-associated protein Cas7/Cst2/DevR [Thermococcus sp. GR7]|uniref:type I-B CRISPR-associated protein Cas7/Cst2/DevR n=1 Tax=unclassified Thermococcus TaxID=2627626 RepID=UPI0014320AFB|nr:MULTISPECIES: type I-B CRISPR-associated protein Cas7/Cst2/DevR [unclassified Thermococcus]NJE46306.1 type I-B CRISPR-associated protein Cas7/Cst2/DevR [Thermococcus sp. GR7]NJE79289.1 type I-B CRISPR-associated protein Cas7/Cst2/DevR [Thermococcus sp. GR4]NJF23815.1 type I-B CRISPR-associated protein Cas7/Cst2/DevR [Thermococcus sp. GR5]
MGRFLVMDVVFYGSSLNYDQGSGNYQELKKITRWDGRQYTLVSRYALRYSLLETGKKLGLWEVAGGEKLHWAGSGDNTVIQPATDLLLTGEILLYPEFDLFGYLITSTTPQNFRGAPAKLSHAISMTPFNYDTLFNANLGMANRMRKIHGEMKPNPFTAEEHETFYLYSLVVDIDEVGKLDVFITLGSDVTLGRDDNGKEIKAKIEDVVSEDNRVKFILKVGKSKKELVQDERVKLEAFEKINNKLVHIRYSLPPEEKRKRVEKLIKGVLSLKRSIKGREEDLRPRLLVLGIYKDTPYQTFKDRIQLLDEYSEEEYDEIEEREENGKKVVRIKHVVSKSKKPMFQIVGLPKDINVAELNESGVLSAIEKLLQNGEKLSEVKVFKDPSIEVRLK